MKIIKILNNNAVTVLDNKNKEIIVIGPGIALGKKSGDDVEDKKIESILTLENKGVFEKFIKLISEIPVMYVEICEEIIKLAEATLGKRINQNIFLTLTDHVSFALERHKKGLDIKNPMLSEIKRFYKHEYSIGLKALEIIKAKLGVELHEDEAASIALHIVNAQLNEDMPNVVNITNMMQEILNIIKYNFSIDFDEDSLTFHRLVTHLKFFAQRMLNNKQAKSGDEYLYLKVKTNYPEAYRCAEKIRTYIKKAYDFSLSMEEMTYLIIHIQRLISR